MKRKILIFIYFISYYLGIIHLFYWLNRKKQRVLVFHHIINDSHLNDSFEQKLVCTSKSLFEKQIQIVNHRLNVTTTLNEPNSAIITFDDGYRCALIAEEVLSKYENKAYIFMPINNIGSFMPLWIDHIMAWFAYVPNGVYTILGNKYEISTNVNRRIAFSKIIDNLYIVYNKNNLLEELNENYPFDSLCIDEDYFSYRFQGLTINEINDLKLKGYKIGAHSINHDILSMLSEKELSEDYDRCIKLYNNIYNTLFYAYPYGHPRDVNDKVIENCRKSGFNHAFMNESNLNSSSHYLSRINISYYHNRYEIEANLSGMVTFVKQKLSKL